VDCEEVGIESHRVELDTDAPTEDLYDVIEDLNGDPSVHGILVQMAVPDHVDERRVRRAIDPMKDVDGFHSANVGRLVASNDRCWPCTRHGIQKLLEACDVETEDADAVIVDRSNIVGKPLANLLLQKQGDGNATVTACSRRGRTPRSRWTSTSIATGSSSTRPSTHTRRPGPDDAGLRRRRCRW
jgi:methylenetetrahydrofolate dehydrogenase (NADP+)/methenyltetrahydrofolate cyclohydrolase